jgi:hypothetical protein
VRDHDNADGMKHGLQSPNGSMANKGGGLEDAIRSRPPDPWTGKLPTLGTARRTQPYILHKEGIACTPAMRLSGSERTLKGRPPAWLTCERRIASEQSMRRRTGMPQVRRRRRPLRARGDDLRGLVCHPFGPPHTPTPGL